MTNCAVLLNHQQINPHVRGVARVVLCALLEMNQWNKNRTVDTLHRIGLPWERSFIGPLGRALFTHLLFIFSPFWNNVLESCRSVCVTVMS